jgi:energy-coupling factor transporter ATP-binding protein EcfA2
MITRFRIENYKALRDVTLHLTPIHVLIGPNDSGKTSILEAMDALCRSVDHPLVDCFPSQWDGLELVNRRSHLPVIEFAADVVEPGLAFSYCLGVRFDHTGRKASLFHERFDRRVDGRTLEPEIVEFPAPANYEAAGLSGVARYSKLGPSASGAEQDLRTAAGQAWQSLHDSRVNRWIPRYLALPVAPDLERRFRLERSGFGLAQCLDEILSHDRALFDAIEARFREFFPAVKSLRLPLDTAYRAPLDSMDDVLLLTPSPGKAIHFSLGKEEGEIPASQASDGMLLILAYLTLQHLPVPPRLLLVEEPENGIHPSRLEDILKILRLISEGGKTQVILTTHSPLVLNHMHPKEVTLCRRDSNGDVEIRRLSESKPVSEQNDFFTLGEIWTLDGDERLMEPTSPTDSGQP